MHNYLVLYGRYELDRRRKHALEGSWELIAHLRVLKSPLGWPVVTSIVLGLSEKFLLLPQSLDPTVSYLLLNYP